MRNTLVFILALASFASSAQKPSESLDQVVAQIGNRIIMTSDIYEHLSYMKRNKNGLPKDASCIVLDQLLVQNLMLVQAERDSLPVKDEEVEQQTESRIEQILGYMNGDRDQFFNYYRMTPEQMKDKMMDDIRDQILMQRMQAQIMEKVTITPSEVQAFFKKIPKDSLPFFNSEVEVAQIVIKPQISKEEDAKALQLASEIRQRIVEKGEDFATLAKKYSCDKGSGAQGGDVGMVERGRFVPEYEAAVFKMKNGEISQLVKSKFGYHIIQLIERRGNSFHSKHILICPEITAEDLSKAKIKLDSIATLIRADSFSFKDGVKKFSEHELTKTQAGSIQNPKSGEPYFELSDLDSDIYFAIDKLKSGEVSNAIEFTDEEGKLAYRIIHLVSRTQPHIANLKADYSRIQTAALEEKKALYVQKWVEERIKSNFVKINSAYLACPSLAKWGSRP